MMDDYTAGAVDVLDTFADNLERESQNVHALVPIQTVIDLLREARARIAAPTPAPAPGPVVLTMPSARARQRAQVIRARRVAARG